MCPTCRSFTACHPLCPDAPNYDDAGDDASVMDADAYSRASEDELESILADVAEADREAAAFRAGEAARATETEEGGVDGIPW